jgi:hypothetical protein
MRSYQRSEQRDPGRRGEFQREHRGKRQQRHRQRPGVLPDEVGGVAREMQPHPAQPEVAAELRPHEQQRAQHHDPEAQADGQDFEDIEVLGQRADGHGAGRERDHGAGHPEDDSGEWGSDHVDRLRCESLKA